MTPEGAGEPTREGARGGGIGVRAIRRALGAGAVVTCAGLAWSAVAPSPFATATLVAGIVVCVLGTHRFGRQGPDPG